MFVGDMPTEVDMKMLSTRALTFMAAVLIAATAATAATAFAGDVKRLRVSKAVAESVHAVSKAHLRAKARNAYAGNTIRSRVVIKVPLPRKG